MTVVTKPKAQPRAFISLRSSVDFVVTSTTSEIIDRALGYLRAGFPVHFRGPAGTGKTTLALHIAAQLDRPVMLMVGDEQLTSSDLVGEQNGYRYRRVVDRYIHSVVKYEEDAVQNWVDNRLTTACREGFTLVYDEFTRSRPEANNVLLAALEERVLVLPTSNGANAYVKVHPDFRAIFTSNPQEYAGVHDAPDALSDRLVTMDLDYYDRPTEISITASNSGLDLAEVERVVDIVREFRDSGEYDQAPTLRACIMIARVSALQGIRPSLGDKRFVQICLDVLESKTAYTSKNRDRRTAQRKMLVQMIDHHMAHPLDAERV
ncbi:gas vesicle protein GvpN [Chloroflexales bacterium ZM16-3]|nr:gas vesicle protein GvpN [Chloroflexales bacterium ZM16-3]